MPGPGRLSERFKAVQHLTHLLTTGVLSGEEDPSYVHRSDPVFQPYKLDNFRNAYNRVRRKLGLPKSDEQKNSDDLNPMCSSDNGPVLKKRKVESVSSDECFSGGEQLEMTGATPAGCKTFKPFYSISLWEEPKTTTKRISLAILFPSGVESSGVTARVLPGGESLELRCIWPNVFSDIKKLHRKWLRCTCPEQIQVYHPKLLGFESYLKEGRKRNTDPIESVCVIGLPVVVESHIQNKFYLGWHESEAKSLYVELRAQAEEYGVVLEKTDFEIV